MMLSDSTVHALTRCLIDLDDHLRRHVPHRGLLATLVLAQDWAVGPATDRARCLRLMHLHLHHTPGQARILAAALDQVADALADPAAATADPLIDPDELAALRHMLHEPLPDLRNLAWAVCYDDLTAHDSAISSVYHIDVVDQDGRIYQYEHPTGDTPRVVIHDHPALSGLPGEPGLPATYPALHRLTTHLQAPTAAPAADGEGPS